MDDASEYVILFVYGSLLLLLLIFGISMLVVLSKQKSRNYQLTLQETKQRFEHELLKVKFELEEEAFELISAEIHDNIGQVLSSASLALQSINPTQSETHIRKIIEESVIRINEATDDLRHLSRAIRGARVEQLGLIGSIDRELSLIRMTGQIRTTFSHPDEEDMPQLEGFQTLLLFRIVQEALHNIIKHARATKLRIAIAYADLKNELHMQIEDNGIGLCAGTEELSGLGIVSMKQRATMLRGSFDIRRKEKGTIIELSISLRDE